LTETPPSRRHPSKSGRRLEMMVFLPRGLGRAFIMLTDNVEAFYLDSAEAGFARSKTSDLQA
jgi:hypothetical protein